MLGSVPDPRDICLRSELTLLPGELRVLRKPSMNYRGSLGCAGLERVMAADSGLRLVAS